jgi:GDP-L-fucose synthase
MNIIATELPDVLLIEPRVFGDARGWFVESWQRERYRRGRHRRRLRPRQPCPSPPAAPCAACTSRTRSDRASWCRSSQGEVFDVAVDARRGSPTSDAGPAPTSRSENKHQLWVPKGFLHGFLVLSPRPRCSATSAPTSTTRRPSSPCAGTTRTSASAGPIGGEPLLSDKDRKRRCSRDPARAIAHIGQVGAPSAAPTRNSTEHLDMNPTRPSTSPATEAWSARPSSVRYRPAAKPNIVTRTHAELDLTSHRPSTPSSNSQTAAGLPRGGQGRRHSRQRHLSGRLHLSEPDDRGQYHPRGLAPRGRAAAVPRQLLHLSASRRATDAESALLTGTLEPTNEPYAIAKIAGIKLCESYNRQHGTDFRSVMPTNLYGPGRQLRPRQQPRHTGADPQVPRGQERRAPRSWFGAAASRSASSCTSTIWPPPACTSWISTSSLSRTPSRGSRTSTSAPAPTSPSRSSPIWWRGGGLDGEIASRTTKPDGAPRKLLDVGRLQALGWKARIALRRRDWRQSYAWFWRNQTEART